METRTLTRFATDAAGTPLTEVAEYARIDGHPKGVKLPGEEGDWFLLKLVGNLGDVFDLTKYVVKQPDGTVHLDIPADADYWAPLSRPVRPELKELDVASFAKVAAAYAQLSTDTATKIETLVRSMRKSVAAAPTKTPA
jgi:hypothetical protein